jgi:ABC-type tungstate transport system substrate-binding protein
LELPAIVTGGAAIFVLALVLSFAITVPVSFGLAICVYPFLRTLKSAGSGTFGIIGFLVGALVWLGIWRSGEYFGNLYFGSWESVIAIAGPAGGFGGVAFFRYVEKHA